MIVCDNWNQLVSEAQSVCKNILKNDVAPVAVDILRKHIQEDIYDAYTPKTNGWVVMRGIKWERQTYQRRNSLPKGVTFKIHNDKELVVTSEATPQPPISGAKIRYKGYGSLLYLLESANMGLWRGGFPRPAVTNTQDEFNNGSEIATAISNGVSKRFR